MNKLWTIAWKELYTRFTDRNLILIMIATPLALSTIMGLAFGGLGSGNAPVRDIPVLVVNHDLGNESGVNYGEVFLSLLVPGTDSSGATGAVLPACSLDGEAENTQENVQFSLQELTEAQAFGAEQAQAPLPAHPARGTARPERENLLAGATHSEEGGDQFIDRRDQIFVIGQGQRDRALAGGARLHPLGNELAGMDQ